MTKTCTILIGAALTAAFSVSCSMEGAKQARQPVMGDAVEESYTDEHLTATEFVTWCAEEEHQLQKTKEISELNYKLSYLPAEVMAFLELRTGVYDLSTFNKTKESYSEMSYFHFRIEAPKERGELLKYKLQSPGEYDARVKYMAYGMQNDIFLVQGKDTLSPGLFHFERAFETAPYATVMLAFDNKKFNKSEEFTVVYNDRLFDKGFMKFNYKTQQLINLPSITGL